MKRSRKLNLTVALFASALILATPAVAGKKAEITGTIELNTRSSSSGGIIASYGSLSYGDKVSFLTEVIGQASSQSLTYITVVCLQQDTVVYQLSADRDFAFTLRDQPGQDLDWDGGEADCTGTLVYREEQGRKVTIMFLDETTFSVQGRSS